MERKDKKKRKDQRIGKIREKKGQVLNECLMDETEEAENSDRKRRKRIKYRKDGRGRSRKQ